MKKLRSGLIIVSTVVLMAGCGAGDAAGGKEVLSTGNKQVGSMEPATLVMYGNLSNEYAEQYIFSHIKKNLPHLTIKYVLNEKGKSPQELVAAGEIPDLVFFPTNQIYLFHELGFLTDLSPFIKSQNMDLNRISNGLIDSVKAYSPNGEILAMPWGTGNYALYYNKTIFDRFAVPYPKDGITWDQAHDLAVRLTRKDGDVQYRGLAFNESFAMSYNQLSLPLVDQKSEKTTVNTDAWKKYFENFARFNKIPGNEYDPKMSINNDFVKNQTLAMTAGATLFIQLRDAGSQGNPVNYDVVSFPVFPEAPGKSLQFVASAFGISATSKYKDQAMQVINLMMSDAVQKEGAEIVRLSALKNPEVRNATGKSDPILEAKNLKALYVNDMAATKVTTKYDGIASAELLTWFNKYRSGTDDVNTILRSAEEAINKKIQEEIAKKK